jgi:class 3 adenylate cyclase
MGSDLPSTPQLEIAHVLFLDVVGYSRLPMEEQRRVVRELQGMVRQTAEYRRADANGELLRAPAGDGMALVFFRDPVAPVRCAFEIAEALCRHAPFRLRMGIHCGPVYRGEDINGAQNVSGAGINLAQRVMDCGDAGHILASHTAADFLRHLADWAAFLHDIGECEVKHGDSIHLFNVYTDALGNPVLPAAVARGPAAPSAAPAVSAAATEGSAAARRTLDHRPPAPACRVALLYKRNAQPDEKLLALLETQLAAHGHRVFIDRHMSIGVAWAKEIERQVRGADAVIPLLSAASIHSEMLAYEVQIAQEAAQEQEGKPRLLPVRVAYTGPLPEALARTLEPVHYTLWEGPQDDEQLVLEMVNALRDPPAPRPVVPPSKLEPVGGAVPLSSQFYVVRPVDEEFRCAIARQDSIVLVKGARQMGKTSLLARGLQQAREAGARVIFTDFQAPTAEHLTSPVAFYRTLADWIADQLDLDVLPDRVWNSDRDPNMNFQRFLRREVLTQIDTPVVWGLDEVDRLFTCPFGSEVFGLFRSWHNARSLDPTGPWSRLTLAIAYATEAHLFITDMNQSPFNIGTRLALDDFTFEQAADLNRRYGSPLRDEREVARFFRLVGGHPYLVRRGLHEMTTQGTGYAALETEAARDEGIYGDHLRRMLVLLVKDADLSEAVGEVLRGRPCASPESFFRLRSAGVIVGDTPREARPRCELYATYLERHLL